MPVIFEKSGDGKNTFRVPDRFRDTALDIPEEYLNNGPDLPDVGEVELVRHYTALSRMNFGVDNGMYPLGSCTMKYNPKINETLVPGTAFSGLHPLAGTDVSQEALRLLYDLSRYLGTITGMDAVSLAPAAGAHGELAGVMIIKKYFESLGEKRNVILIPDSAHGTNPASVAMCGFTVQEVPSNADGDVDIDKLKTMLNKDVAAMMLTSPNTLGLFDRQILTITDMLHKNGSLFYGDGANLNATIGKTRMSDMGFDIIHLNLHKTFSTPHGGGGPGAGPIGVVEKLVKFLPVPVIEHNEEGYYINYDRPDSIGPIHSYYGNFLVAMKAYIYIRMLGAEGIKKVAEHAVLNANYLLAKLKDQYNVPIKRSCMHEFVLNDKDFPNGVSTNDIAKRILDYGYHAPTVYFPLLVPGALMIEPTETESKKALDDFTEIMIRIKEEAATSPDMVKSAPHNTPVKRVDAVTAARRPILKWKE